MRRSTRKPQPPWLGAAILSAFLSVGSASGGNPETALWEAILRARVNERGEVAYRALEFFDSERLAAYVQSLGSSDLAAASPEDTIAFWINAYNAGVVFGILHGGTPETLAGRARLYHWFAIQVAGEELTLDEIEAKLAPFAAEDPRIRFALCNGARGSPPLAREPYVGQRLREQLETAAERFVTDPRWNRFDLPARRAVLSPVFEWHREEFERIAPSVLAYASRYVRPAKAASILRRPEIAVQFGEFDWSLNAAPGERPR